MLFIIGTRIKTLKVNDNNISEKTCPLCSGKMNLYQNKQYLTLFFIPIFPFKNFARFFLCTNCNYQITV